MRNLFYTLAASALVLLAGCNSSSSNYVDPYASVRPGMTIYNAAATQNRVALDPAAVAVRLAMLLDEAAVQDKSIEEVSVSYNNSTYKLWNLLFGASVTIREADDAPGDYLITYGESSAAPIDCYVRSGSYRVRTGGRSLAETTEAEPWVAEPVAPVKLTAYSSYSSESYLLRSGSVMLWHARATSYEMRVENLKAHFAGYEKYSSDWSGEFTWSCSTHPETLSFTAHAEDTYTLWGTAEGETFYALNNANPTRMRYSASMSAPVEYRPSKTSNYQVITNGTERAEFTSPLDYSAEAFPSPAVVVRRTLADKLISTEIIYNGVTMPL